ncbi:Carbohydrate-binding module family 14 protein [Mycena venus]|uniref:Carbohydrate-binding module family 14 protein n=1 Tax=Mycena venus TaxID=2733690 RepID=A0A8H7CGE0_9AGAR|nr:Carbohydrate-binding module family 14 protein [Mycena venus]
MTSLSTSKLLALLALFVWQAHASFANSPRSLPARDKSFVCPSQPIINTKCLDIKDCLYANPADCNSYILCAVNADGMTGTPVVMPCAPGLQWNDNDKFCVFPEDSTCPPK